MIILWENFIKKSDDELFLMIFIEAYINSIELNSDIYKRKNEKFPQQGKDKKFQNTRRKISSGLILVERSAFF